MKKILVVDDEVDVRENFREYLMEQGYLAITAENGSEAIDIIDREKPDLLILDIKMPGNNGLDVLTSLHNSGKKIPTIIVTAFDTHKDDFIVCSYGYIVAYLLKPANLRDIAKRIENVFMNR